MSLSFKYLSDSESNLQDKNKCLLLLFFFKETN